jgi:hypothetical protein
MVGLRACRRQDAPDPPAGGVEISLPVEADFDRKVTRVRIEWHSSTATGR